VTENRPPQSPFTPIKQAGGRHVAVAIESDEEKPDSPAKIVASGRGKLAGQILELAYANGIKVREDADLAELLAKLDLDTPIPSEAIVAVAEILAKVYEANEAVASAAPQTPTDGESGP